MDLSPETLRDTEKPCTPALPLLTLGKVSLIATDGSVRFGELWRGQCSPCLHSSNRKALGAASVRSKQGQQPTATAARGAWFTPTPQLQAKGKCLDRKQTQ